MIKDSVGDWLESQRRNADVWLKFLLAALALLVVANVFLRPSAGEHGGGGHGAAPAIESHGTPAPEGHGAPAPEGHGAPAAEEHGAAAGEHGTVQAHGFWYVDHPHFELDRFPGFWALFGVGFACLMALALKKGLFLIVGRSEDYYDRDK